MVIIILYFMRGFMVIIEKIKYSVQFITISSPIIKHLVQLVKNWAPGGQLFLQPLLLPF